jgi:hypothetical protein
VWNGKGYTGGKSGEHRGLNNQKASYKDVLDTVGTRRPVGEERCFLLFYSVFSNGFSCGSSFPQDQY